MEVEKVLVPEELEGVNGGYTTYDPGPFYEMRFKFTAEEVDKLKRNGVGDLLFPDEYYCRSDLNRMFNTSFLTADGMMGFLHDSFGFRHTK